MTPDLAALRTAAAWHMRCARASAPNTGNGARHEYYAERILALIEKDRPHD